MRIVVADDLPASALALLTAEGWDVDARAGRPLEQLKQDVRDADALVVRSATKVTKDVIASGPKLRAIARAGTGVDNVDVAAATARGIVVMNAPGANSISVAELTMALVLALARKIASADASMKQGRWEKKAFVGEEVRGKTLGLAGFGRIGQEVARRALAFEMGVLAHDPFITAERAAALGVSLVSLDDLCANADYLSLHLPSNKETRGLFDADRLARCKRGLRLINTARGDLIDERALADAIESGHIGGAALDVFATEPTVEHRLQQLPQVVATPHIAASTAEGQELVGLETASALCDFLKTSTVRNAVNLPAIPSDQLERVRPFVDLAHRLGTLLAQLSGPQVREVRIEGFGDLASVRLSPVVDAALVGLFSQLLPDGVTAVNARLIAAERGIAVEEAHSSRTRSLTSVLSVSVSGGSGDRRVEGTVSDFGSRLTRIDEVPVQAPLAGMLLVLQNHDQPGVIGEVGTVLGRHQVNIATFALGRGPAGAIGVVNLDEEGGDKTVTDEVLSEIRLVGAVKDVRAVRLPPASTVPAWV